MINIIFQKVLFIILLSLSNFICSGNHVRGVYMMPKILLHWVQFLYIMAGQAWERQLIVVAFQHRKIQRQSSFGHKFPGVWNGNSRPFLPCFSWVTSNIPSGEAGGTGRSDHRTRSLEQKKETEYLPKGIFGEYSRSYKMSNKKWKSPEALLQSFHTTTYSWSNGATRHREPALDYEIHYDLETFTVEFKTNSSGLQLTHMVLYQGFSYFRELRKRTRKTVLENRERTGKGSSLHFMRALSQRELEQNDFRIFYEKFEVAPYNTLIFRKMKPGLRQFFWQKN